MFDKTVGNSEGHPGNVGAESVGRRLDCLLDEMGRQGHAREVQDILEPLVASALNLLDDNTMTTEIHAMAASFLLVYGEDWTVRFDERTQTRLKQLLG